MVIWIFINANVKALLQNLRPPNTIQTEFVLMLVIYLFMYLFIYLLIYLFIYLFWCNSADKQKLDFYKKFDAFSYMT